MEVDQATFRSVLSVVPTSVVVVTGIAEDGAPKGVTIGSFTSVSLNPPLVGFLPAATMGTWQQIRPSGKFCVNVLTSEQEDVCWAFASDKEDRFSQIKWKPSPSGTPLIDGVAAWIDCTLHSETLLGDHYFVAGQVTALGVSENASASMIFYRNSVGHPALGS